MRTIKELKEELDKFPEDCVCFAYEGEVTGIIIEYPGRRLKEQGVIFCSESDYKEPETELIQKI